MTQWSLYQRLLNHVVPYWKIFALAIIATLILAITDPILAALIQPLLDEGFVSKNPETIQQMPLILLGLVIIKGLSLIGSQVGMTWVAARLVSDLRQQMFQKLLTLPTSVFDNISTGILISKVTYDVSRVMAAATDALIILVRDSVTIVGLLIWMFYLNWKLSLIIFITVPLIAIIVRQVGRRLRKINQGLQTSMGDLTRILEEAINGHKLVKIFAGQEYEQTRFNRSTENIRGLEVNIQLVSGISIFTVQLLTAMALAMIVYIASLQSLADGITVGGFVSLFTAMGLLFAPVKRLTKVNEQLQQGLAAAESIFKLIDEPSESTIPRSVNQLGKSDPKMKKTWAGQLSFKQLSFTYPGHSQVVLQEISLVISPGETVAIVGGSGSGKSTLVNLMPRFYPVAPSQIYLDGQDIQELSLFELRRQLAVVTQETVLFNDSIAANIGYGSMQGTDRAAIIEAAKMADAWSFIEELPEGLETLVGEKGVKLSGGQRQRLAIARALLKRAPILILDEATSALDTQTEQKVQRALESLKHQQTMVIIAHRLSTIVHADRIVVLDKGRIVEMGTHLYLLEQGGIYARLYQVQTGP